MLSGRGGLGHLQHWWAERTGDTRRMDGAEVLAGGADAGDPHALEVLSLFVRILGRVTGDLA